MHTLALVATETIARHDIDKPQMRPDEILLQNLACGVCGGDIKTFKGPRSQELTVHGPHPIAGHEFVGQVVAVGAEVRGFAIGERVAHVFNNFCGSCLHCRLGHANFCLNFRRAGGGGFAEQATLYAGAFGRGVFKVPDEISTPEAALCEPLTCAIGAVLKAVPQPGERFAVIGLGGLGHFIAQILASAKVAVIGIDKQPDKLHNAANFCHAVIDASRQDVITETLQLTGNVGVDGVIEVVGIPETVKQAIELARMGGRIVIAGSHQRLADGVNIDRIFRKDLVIKTAKGAAPLMGADGVPLAFRYIQEGITRPSELLTTFPYAEAQAAFMGQAYGGIIKAVILHPNEQNA
jgi:L-iditol 2-dehydrogenase